MDTPAHQDTSTSLTDEKSRPQKPLVHYRELVVCTLGSSALLIPADHPSELVSNTKTIVTSAVVRGLDTEGSFETMNTRYEPAPKIKM